jgi:hypothetical protein
MLVPQLSMNWELRRVTFKMVLDASQSPLPPFRKGGVVWARGRVSPFSKGGQGDFTSFHQDVAMSVWSSP